MTKLVLYSTVGCHLCEQALALILPQLKIGDNIEEVDISDSDQLMERYAIRIPVLYDPELARELGWPFDQQQLQAFLAD